MSEEHNERLERIKDVLRTLSRVLAKQDEINERRLDFEGRMVTTLHSLDATLSRIDTTLARQEITNARMEMTLANLNATLAKMLPGHSNGTTP